MNVPWLSIIIPTYNECENIEGLITYLQQQTNCAAEIIISDAGSTDDTITIAKRNRAIVIHSPQKGRAAQMNYGATQAKGDILYFVHADCRPPLNFDIDIREAVKNGFEFGRYQTKFDQGRFILKLNEIFTRFDLFICYGGDQTMFMTKTLFNRLNGFNAEMLIMEDYDIVTRAKQFSKYKIFNKPALISARKYETNSWLTVLLANKKIIDMYRNGASQIDMVETYRRLLNYR